MDAATCIAIAIACAALSSVPGGLRRGAGAVGSAIGLGVAGGAAVVAGCWGLWAPATLGAPSAALLDGWHGSLAVDGVSAVFLVACGIVAAAAGLFGAGYWRDTDQPAAPWTRLFLGLLVAGMLAVFSAGDVLTFLIAWEVMALAGFALVATQHRRSEARAAAWLYLICTRVATLALIPAAVLFVHLTGSLAWSSLSGVSIGNPAAMAMLILFLIGFGIKAGIVPGHIWLPPAHAAAPSHVSALMSGVLIKTGIYGICRVSAGLDAPPVWWGGTLLTLGAVSSVLGVTWALGSHDLKRLLAYHSIENIGIILLGLGLALVGRSIGNEAMVILGCAGGLLHVLNHALFKSLLFLGAGAVDHACGTRQLDRLGGLARRMPVTAACFLVGAAAICALPPFNGFVSEFLVYQGLFAAVRGGWGWALGGLIALVLTGGLALACFAKAAGVVFLGEPRSPAAAGAHEAGLPERSAMILLAGCCLAIGLGLPLLQPMLTQAAAACAPGAAVALAPLPAAWWVSLAAAAIIAGGWALWRWQARRLVGSGSAGTWDCGYAAPTPRMQYTASSFAAPLTDQLHAVLLPERHHPDLRQYDGNADAVRLFPSQAAFANHPRDPMLERILHPIAQAGAWLCVLLRIAHPGQLHVYLLYLALALIALLLWSLA